MKPSQLIVEEKMARDHVLRPGGITQNLKPENSNFGGGVDGKGTQFSYGQIFLT